MREIQFREFLGAKVVDAEGVHIGRLEEVEAERGDDSCAIIAFIVEHRGLLDRISSWALTSSIQQKLGSRSKPYRVGWNQMDLSDPRRPRTLVPKDMLERDEAD